MAGAILKNLLGFEGAIGIVACKPVAEAFREGVVIERVLQVTHGTIYGGDWVD